MGMHRRRVGSGGAGGGGVGGGDLFLALSIANCISTFVISYRYEQCHNHQGIENTKMDNMGNICNIKVGQQNITANTTCCLLWPYLITCGITAYTVVIMIHIVV